MKDLITATPAQVTMTSLKLVEYINSLRDEDTATLTHADFMKKVPKVLGEKATDNEVGLILDYMFE